MLDSLRSIPQLFEQRQMVLWYLEGPASNLAKYSANKADLDLQLATCNLLKIIVSV